MNFFKTSILNGVSVAIKTIISFFLNKILAVYVGPSGFPLIGQFQNFIQMVTTFSGNAINTAIVKYTAEYYREEEKQHQIWKNAGTLILLMSFVSSIAIILLRKWLSIYIFSSQEYESVFIWFGSFLLFFNFNAMFIAILNGKKEVVKLIIANILGSVFSLLITGFLAIKYGTFGALVAISIYQSVVFLVTLYICYNTSWFKLSYLFGRIEKTVLKKFGSYILMALVTAVCIPVSQMLIRSHIVDVFGKTNAGYWEAMVRLGGAYLMFITTTLSVYYLPRLSELTQKKDLKKEINLGYTYILPVVVFFGSILYFCRDLVIKILFTESFLPMRDLFFWQFFGDTLKVGSWLIAYLMLSKAMTSVYIVTEVLFAVLWVILVYVFCNLFGLKGSLIAYVINYGLYWIVMSIFVFRRIKD